MLAIKRLISRKVGSIPKGSVFAVPGEDVGEKDTFIEGTVVAKILADDGDDEGKDEGITSIGSVLLGVHAFIPTSRSLFLATSLLSGPAGASMMHWG